MNTYYLQQHNDYNNYNNKNKSKHNNKYTNSMRVGFCKTSARSDYARVTQTSSNTWFILKSRQARPFLFKQSVWAYNTSLYHK